jgi:hypothetical protein
VPVAETLPNWATSPTCRMIGLLDSDALGASYSLDTGRFLSSHRRFRWAQSIQILGQGFFFRFLCGETAKIAFV